MGFRSRVSLETPRVADQRAKVFSLTEAQTPYRPPLSCHHFKTLAPLPYLTVSPNSLLSTLIHQPRLSESLGCLRR